eukprot:6055368-Pleurochrysis_carterae.AAC.1
MTSACEQLRVVQHDRYSQLIQNKLIQYSDERTPQAGPRQKFRARHGCLYFARTSAIWNGAAEGTEALNAQDLTCVLRPEDATVVFDWTGLIEVSQISDPLESGVRGIRAFEVLK